MKINKFKMTDLNGDLVEINLDYPLDTNDLLDIISYLTNGEEEYFKKSLNVTDNDIDMVHKALLNELDMKFNKPLNKKDNEFNDANDVIDCKNIEDDITDNLKEKEISNSDDVSDFIKMIDELKKPNMNKEAIENKTEMEEVVNNSFNSIIKQLKENGYKNIYISGPIRGLGYDIAKRSFVAFGTLLKEKGFNVDHTFANPYPNNRNKEYYIKNGIMRMMQADAVVSFNNQVISEGAKIEEEVAEAVNIPYYKANIALVVM